MFYVRLHVCAEASEGAGKNETKYNTEQRHKNNRVTALAGLNVKSNLETKKATQKEL